MNDERQFNRSRQVPFAFAVGLAAALLNACGGSSSFPSTPGVATTALLKPSGKKTFTYTGAEQTFKVPHDVNSISVVADGAGGGSSSALYSGRGGRVLAVIPVRSGKKLYVFVGGRGETLSGGFNGGGKAGSSGDGRPTYGGGGASDVRQGGDSLHDRILVAGGGGGQGSEGYNSGGAGGGSTGGTGGGGYSNYDGEGGMGGTQYQGGSGGIGGIGASKHKNGQPGHNGAFGNGGKGGHGGINRHCEYNGDGGGGGGGGYYGGGGGGGGGCAFASIYGGLGGGGGGGSSYVESSATHAKLYRGWAPDTGNGQIQFRW